MQNINLETGHIYTSRAQSLDSMEVAAEYKHDLDAKYEHMKKSERTFHLWLDRRDPSEDEDFINSEKYARSLKSQQI